MASTSIENSIRRVPRETILLGVIAGLATGIFYELLSGILVVLGAGLASLSFLTLNLFVDKYLQANRSGIWRRPVFVYVLRVLLICLIFLIIIFFFKGKVLALVGGFSLMIVSVLIEAVRGLVSVKQWKA